jgi:hypothetical protein
MHMCALSEEVGCMLSGTSMPNCSVNLLAISQWCIYLTQQVMDLLLTGDDQSQGD